MLQDWTEMRVAWSPSGTYLATFHSRGIAVWAGSRFAQLARFPHQRLETLDFSPRERFLLLCFQHFTSTLGSHTSSSYITTWPQVSSHLQQCGGLSWESAWSYCLGNEDWHVLSSILPRSCHWWSHAEVRIIGFPMLFPQSAQSLYYSTNY